MSRSSPLSGVFHSQQPSGLSQRETAIHAESPFIGRKKTACTGSLDESDRAFPHKAGDENPGGFEASVALIIDSSADHPTTLPQYAEWSAEESHVVSIQNLNEAAMTGKLRKSRGFGLRQRRR